MRGKSYEEFSQYCQDANLSEAGKQNVIKRANALSLPLNDSGVVSLVLSELETETTRRNSKRLEQVLQKEISQLNENFQGVNRRLISSIVGQVTADVTANLSVEVKNVIQKEQKIREKLTFASVGVMWFAMVSIGILAGYTYAHSTGQFYGFTTWLATFSPYMLILFGILIGWFLIGHVIKKGE